MQSKFSANLNPHYPFEDAAHQAEIARQEKLQMDGALIGMIPYLTGGGSITPSPWGSNRSVDAGIAHANTLGDYLSRYGLVFSQLMNIDVPAERPDPIEFCIKDLVVNPGHQLSLQRHRGREEFWVVQRGLLTVIVDGQRIDVAEGQAIFIPMGATHCMNNCTDEPIAVQELQLGICREEDNMRLLDATRDSEGCPAPRPTYPITNDIQYKSAVLFAQLATEISLKNGLPIDPQFKPFIIV